MLAKAIGPGADATLRDTVRQADAMTPALLRAIVAQSGRRLSLLNRQAMPVKRLDELLRAGAEIDTLLALMAVETPRWRLRRIVCDGGEWHCALGRDPNMPIEIDDLVETRHASLACAVALALLDAQTTAAGVESSVSDSSPATVQTACCDNFA